VASGQNQAALPIGRGINFEEVCVKTTSPFAGEVWNPIPVDVDYANLQRRRQLR
jgi:hypothetical protein